MLWSKNLKNKSYMTVLAPSFQYVDNLFPWFAPDINGFVRATLAIKRDTRRTEPVFNRHRPGVFWSENINHWEMRKNAVSSNNRYVMFRCQTRMSCKHPGKGDLFKVVGMFIPNKASSPTDDFVFCVSNTEDWFYWLLERNQSRISSELEWALSGTILLLVIGTSFVEIANVRNQIIENLDVPIFS